MYDSFRVAKLLSHESLWKEWTSFTIQDVRRVLPRNFVHCFQRRFHIRLGYETLSFLFLEQCFQLSLSDEIGGTFFDIDNFSIIPKYIFFDIDNLPIIWKMPIYRLSIIFSIISPTPTCSPSKVIANFSRDKAFKRIWSLKGVKGWDT